MFLASADSAVESNSKNCNGASNLQGSSNALEDSYSDIGQHNILSVAGKYYFVLTLPLSCILSLLLFASQGFLNMS